ncbi:MAG: TIGR02584 family CRISPR-associated protein [Chromatiales bacterium]|nr:TIGR02584 family CRISPR-associated protein [Chromatiales bacterium]
MNRQPHEYQRRILLMVTGRTPQVVTETIYGLAKCRKPPFVPTEIHLISTRDGERDARLTLLSDDPGWFHRLRRDWKLPAIEFGEANIHVIKDANGEKLDDIRTPEENERCADFITALVREFATDANSALHVSLAGGRKTMTYYLGNALALFGRAQDRLSHVLVSAPFETHRDFYYPTPYSHVIQTQPGGRHYDARDAVVELADIPFLQLRHIHDHPLLDGQTRFSDVVRAANRALAPPHLTIDLKNSRIRAGEQIVKLAPASLALLVLFARRVLDGEPPIEAPPKKIDDKKIDAKLKNRDLAKRYLAEYRRIRGEMGDTAKTEKAYVKGIDGDQFSTTLSRLHKRLRAALGPGATPYMISDGGKRPRRYRLALAANAIQFGEIPAEGKAHPGETIGPDHAR